MPETRLNLDDITYNELVAGADISLEEWSDRNAHDPGIMLLELFAWLTEMQRFYINQLEYKAGLTVLSAAETPGDYEKLTLELPDVKKCRAYFENRHSVCIAAEGNADAAAILRHVEPYRLLGTEISIVTPHYVKLRVTAEVNGKPFRRDIKPLVESGLKEYLLSEYGDFGTSVSPIQIADFLVTLDVVESVLAVKLDAEGIGAASIDGDVRLSPRSILQWGGLDLYVH